MSLWGARRGNDEPVWMAEMDSPSAQQRGGSGSDAANGKGVAESNVRRQTGPPRHGSSHDPGRVWRQRIDYASVGVDDPRDAGRRRANQVAPRLHGPEDGHGEMLPARDA